MNEDDQMGDARVICDRGILFDVTDTGGETLSVSAPKSLMASPERRPAVGDWVVLDATRDQIQAIVPRRTEVARKAAGLEVKRQVIAANVDVVIIVTSMNQELNESRLERYLSMVWSSGATPWILLNKSDLSDQPQTFVERAKSTALGCEVLAVNALEPGGLKPLLDRLQANQTYLLVGSSGVGKSTITNALIGEETQKTSAIRDDDEGRHTTTNRRLIPIPGDRGYLIDTPGMRELQLWDADDGVAEAFADVEALTNDCRFRDCKHDQEPGCAVRNALSDGSIEHRRINNYLKLQAELAFQESKRDLAAARAENRKFSAMVKAAKKLKKFE